jgi:glycyl-tRNA synthetase beta chain
MQQQAGEALLNALADALAPLAPSDLRAYTGPRRIAATLTVAAQVPGRLVSERGPREGAPDKALDGFTRKYNVTRDALVLRDGFWLFERDEPAVDAATQIAAVLPDLLRRFPWPKSMRWGQGQQLYLGASAARRILCLLDGAVVPFSLAQGQDNGHGRHSANLTEGHRFMAPDTIPVSSAAQWKGSLHQSRVMVGWHRTAAKPLQPG